MRVKATWTGRPRRWRLWDVEARRVVGHADRVLLRDVMFCPSGTITGDLEAACCDSGAPCGDAVLWCDWTLVPRDNAAYAATAARHWQAVSLGEDGWTVDHAPMVFLGHTRGAVTKRKPGILAFDPCQMDEGRAR